MRQTVTWIREGLVIAGYTLLVTAGVLLAPLIALATRLLMPLFLAALLAGFVVSCLSPRFRQWIEKDRVQPIA